VSPPLETFAGLLDRSVREIAALAADARTFDAYRISRIADIWDNNTFPLVSAACAPPALRDEQARAGLEWMADLGTARRELMVDLDPALDGVLPPSAPERSVHRDYLSRVRPGSFPVTAEVIADLVADYDLAGASVRSLAVRPAGTALQVHLTLAAPRRFVPSTGRVAKDGSGRPWPPAPLAFTFDGVTGMRFDAEDRVGLAVTCQDAGFAVVIGHGGSLLADRASVWPDDPVWHESAAGRAADTTTPRESPRREVPAPRSSLTSQQEAAAEALVILMLHVRLAGRYPGLAASVPVREICRVAAGAGGAILAAGATRGYRRRKAFAGLIRRWRRVPADVVAASIPPGPAMLRYAWYDEPHEYYDVHRDGSAVLVAAVPDADPAAPWRLAGDEIAQPARFRITATAFDGVQQVHRDSDALDIGDSLAVQPR
jgi:hypothetical protein